jgi:hypothetical protein|nr:MAG TPA: hypothetical protein [Caudoviricetes sp.]
MSTSYGLGFEPFPLLLDYELSEHLMLRTDATKNALFLGSHMNGKISDMSEALDEYEEAGHSDEDVYAEEERLWRELCSRLITGESDCCEAMSRFYDSLIIDYSTDEAAREWLQGKGLYLPVVPISDEPDSNESALPDFAPGLGDDYLEQLNDLFWMYPGFTEDGKPCVWVCPGRWRMTQVVLMAESICNPALFLMRAWDWDSGDFQEIPREVSAEARDNWIIDGYLDRAEISYNFTRTEIEYRLPEETRKELERGLIRSRVYGKNVKLARRVRVLDYSAEYNGMVCKVGIDIG